MKSRCVQRDAVLRRLVHQSRHEVGAVLAAPLLREVVAVLEHLECGVGSGTAAAGTPPTPSLVASTSACSGSVLPTIAVAPGDELVDVLVGHVEQPGEHADGEVGRHVGDEVELAFGERGVERGGREPAQERLVPRDGSSA